MEQRGCGGQGNYSIYYYRGGCMSLYMSKPIAYTPRMTPSVNYGYSVIRMCQWKFINCKKKKKKKNPSATFTFFGPSTPEGRTHGPSPGRVGRSETLILS